MHKSASAINGARFQVNTSRQLALLILYKCKIQIPGNPSANQTLKMELIIESMSLKRLSVDVT